MSIAIEDARVTILRDRIITEILFALGIKRNSQLRRLLGPLFNRPANRFARLAAEMEEAVARGGLPEGGRVALPAFNVVPTAIGQENIPLAGPLLLACNHPGAYDSAIVASLIPRPDLKIFASDVPFTRALTETSAYLLYVSESTGGRMAAVRAAVQHLTQGGAILIFARGDVEPDPAVMSGAADTIDLWSASIALLLRKVPQTCLQIAMASNIIQARYLRNPLIRLRKQPYHRQKMAELFQMVSQLLFPGRYEVRAQFSFGQPVLATEIAGSDIMKEVKQLAHQQLNQHCQHYHLPS